MVDLAEGNVSRRLEIGRQEGLPDPPREPRAVLVDDGDGGVVQLL
jgi:hypothetical protein